MNQINVHNVDVIVDYCHNAPGMRVLGEFLERYAAMKAGPDRPRQDLADRHRSPPPATAATSDMRELGSIAAEHFDVVVVREDERLRGRERGFTAEQVAEGVRSRIGEPGVRCRQVEIVLDETEAVRHVMARANPGDIVVLCVDQHAAVMAELESMTKQAQPGTHTQRLGRRPRPRPRHPPGGGEGGRRHRRPRPRPGSERLSPGGQPAELGGVGRERPPVALDVGVGARRHDRREQVAQGLRRARRRRACTRARNAATPTLSGCARGDVVDDGQGLVVPPDVAQARRELQLGAVPVRLAQPGRQGLLVERHGVRLVAGAVVGAGELVGDPGVTGVRGVQRRRRRGTAPRHPSISQSAVISSSASCSPRARDDLAADGVAGRRHVAPRPRSQATTSARSAWHMSATTSPSSATSRQRLQARRARSGRTRCRATPARASPSRSWASRSVGGAPAQVVVLVGRDDVVGAQPGDLTERLEDVVGAVAGGAEREVHPAAGRREPAGHVEQRLEAGLVVREVDDDGDLAARRRRSV